MKHRLRAAALASLVAAFASGCTALSPDAASHNGRHSWTIPGVLRIGYAEEPDNLNPLFGNSAAADDADALIFAPLFRYDQHGEFFPELATEVPSYANGGISKDNKTI